MKAKQFVGRVFGQLHVLAEVEAYISPSGYRDRQFQCLCECGSRPVVRSASLRRGLGSCGCSRPGAVKHGHALAGNQSKTYRSWADMIRRCDNAADKNYGGRGIKVCDRWRSFDNFLADMGEKPAGLTLERDDVNGDYEPGNCRWASMRVQTRNKRTNVKLDEVVLTDAAQALGLTHSAISVRLKRGWSLERAMTTPRWHKSKSGHVKSGADHPMAKLTDAEVADIRQRLATGEKGAHLAREFGVSRSMISRIKRGQAWVS